MVADQGVAVGGGPSRGVTRQQEAFPGHSCKVCGRLITRHSSFWCSRRCKDRAYNRANPVARQHSLPLEPALSPLLPVQDQRVPRVERQRLSLQSQHILEALRRGPVMNRELAEMFPPGTAWRSRVSDVRQWLERRGETVRSKTSAGGLCMYWLENLR